MASSRNLLFATLFAVLLASSNVQAGPLAYGICQAGCAGIAVACFAAAGFTFGTVAGAVIAASPVLAACNTAYGGCYAACSAALVLPTP